VAVFVAKELFFFGAIVFQFHGLKRRWFQASVDFADLWFVVGIKGRAMTACIRPSDPATALGVSQIVKA
jgi:hypothetical protein